MGFSVGIVGLPNVGKSTLFNALTRANALVANYPFCTIDRNVGAVPIPDPRLEALRDIARAEAAVPSALNVVDIAGLVKGASRGEGLGNRFLAHIREVEAVLHVVRCFGDPGVSHVTGRPDPLADVQTVELELMLADLELAERRREKLRKMLKGGGEGHAAELSALEKLISSLESGVPGRVAINSPEDLDVLRPLGLITLKPTLYVANVSENQVLSEGLSEEYLRLQGYVEEAGGELLAVCASMEAQLAELEAGEREEFARELGLEESALSRVVAKCKELLSLITFFTVNRKEAHAWLVPEGTRAPQAAGKVHSQMEQGFVRAEVISMEELVEAGSFAEARNRGLIRLEGRDYEVREGDILYFRFTE